MKLVKEFDDGISLWVKPNEVGGRTYITDEIGCGVMVWDTALISERLLIAAMQHEKEQPHE